MGDALSLIVPPEDETLGTIREYYQYYFNHMDSYISEESFDEFTRYQHAVETMKNRDDFLVWEQVFGDISDKMCPDIYDVYRRYADGSGALSNEYGLAKLVQTFEQFRGRMVAQNTLEDHDDRAIQSYITLVNYAIENGYGVSYP